MVVALNERSEIGSGTKPGREWPERTTVKLSVISEDFWVRNCIGFQFQAICLAGCRMPGGKRTSQSAELT